MVGGIAHNSAWRPCGPGDGTWSRTGMSVGRLILSSGSRTVLRTRMSGDLNER